MRRRDKAKQAAFHRNGQRLWKAMFELDTIIGRVMMHELLRSCPLSMYDHYSTLQARF